jgi:hypothetical protein
MKTIDLIAAKKSERKAAGLHLRVVELAFDYYPRNEANASEFETRYRNNGFTVERVAA